MSCSFFLGVSRRSFSGVFHVQGGRVENTPTSEFPRPHGQLSKNPDPLSRIGLRHPCDTVDG